MRDILGHDTRVLLPHLVGHSIVSQRATDQAQPPLAIRYHTSIITWYSPQHGQASNRPSSQTVLRLAPQTVQTMLLPGCGLVDWEYARVFLGAVLAAADHARQEDVGPEAGAVSAGRTREDFQDCGHGEGGEELGLRENFDEPRALLEERAHSGQIASNHECCGIDPHERHECFQGLHRMLESVFSARLMLALLHVCAVQLRPFRDPFDDFEMFGRLGSI